MTFEKLVAVEIEPVLTKRGFKSTSYGQGMIEFRSKKIEIRLTHWKMDRSNTFSLGKVGEMLTEMRNDVINSVLHSDIRLENKTPEDFINNVRILIEHELQPILDGEVGMLEKISDYARKNSELYTADLALLQNKEIADNNWMQGDYAKFIEIIDVIGLKNLPGSYRLKYDLAKKRV